MAERSEKNGLLLSLMENVARRRCRQKEPLREFGDLRQQGYTVAKVAGKTGFSPGHDRDVLRLAVTSSLTRDRDKRRDWRVMN